MAKLRARTAIATQSCLVDSGERAEFDKGFPGLEIRRSFRFVCNCEHTFKSSRPAAYGVDTLLPPAQYSIARAFHPTTSDGLFKPTDLHLGDGSEEQLRVVVERRRQNLFLGTVSYDFPSMHNGNRMRNRPNSVDVVRNEQVGDAFVLL